MTRQSRILFACVGITLFGLAFASSDANEGASNSSETHSGGSHHAFTGLLFPWIAELLGIITLHLLSRYAPDIPYTAVLFVEGILLGVAHQQLRPADGTDTWGQLGESITTWSSIDPHLLLFAFLPALLFGDAVETNWYLFKKSFWQVLWLAVPGMLAGSALTAVLAYGLLPYAWTFNLCMTLGSILAATDPVAVVALLKELGASPGLTMLISGESMLNDGTAIVMFDIFSNLYLHEAGSPNGETFTVGSGFAKFFRMALGGTGIGILLGVATIMWFSFLNRRLEETDATMQLSLTITAAYLSYYLADGILGTSGVLSVVFTGTFVAAFGQPLISSRETMETVWKAIEHLGNTLLFVLGGVVWGTVVADTRNRAGHIEARDWGFLIVMYLAVLVSRAVMIGVSFPALSRMGVPTTREDALFMTWGGLRGAVGIALALSLDQRIQLDLQDNFVALQTGSRVIFHVGGIAVLTLVINGQSSAFILRKLGLTGTTEARKKVLSAVHSRMEKVAIYTFEKALKQELFSCVDPEAVASLVPLLADDPVVRRKSLLQARNQMLSRRRMAVPLPRRTPSTLQYNRAMEYHQVVITLREVFLDLLRAAYWGLIRDGVLREDSFSAYVLLQSCDIAARDAGRGVALNDWEAVAGASNSIEYRIDRTINFVMGKAPLVKKHDVVYKQEQLKVHTALCFIKAHHKAQRELRSYYGRMHLEEETGRPGSRDEEEDREDHVVVQESDMEVRKAARVIDSVDPLLVSSTINKTVAAIVLDAQGKYIRRAQEEGMIHEKEAQGMFHEVQHQLAALHWANHHKLKSDPAVVEQGKDGWCVHMVDEHYRNAEAAEISGESAYGSGVGVDVFNPDGIGSAVQAAEAGAGVAAFSAIRVPGRARRARGPSDMLPIIEADPEDPASTSRSSSNGSEEPDVDASKRMQHAQSSATMVDDDGEVELVVDGEEVELVVDGEEETTEEQRKGNPESVNDPSTEEAVSKKEPSGADREKKSEPSSGVSEASSSSPKEGDEKSANGDGVSSQVQVS